VNKSFYILVSFFILGCESKQPIEQPSILLNKSQLIGVIVDVQILESHYNNMFQRKQVYANALDSATYFVFENHNINKSIFKENLKYYSHQPDTLFGIYESALDTINNRINSGVKKQ